MKFLYDKSVDTKCHQRLEACESIFSESKKSGSYEVTPEVLSVFLTSWTAKVNLDFQSGMENIFHIPISESMPCYVNSTPYSMDTPDGISVSASTKTPIRSICHETNHYLFRRSRFHDIFFHDKNIEEAKEIFVIVNNLYFRNIMESQDIGWKVFWKERYAFLELWIRYQKDSDASK